MLSSATIAQSDSAATDLHQTTPTQFIDVNGAGYAYRVFGAASGIPLVMLQHFSGNMDNWDPAVTNGLAKYFRAVLFDNQGVGASGGETPATIEGMAQDAISFIRALGFKKVNVLGFSMGGFIAQQIALGEPDLIDKLILVGTGPKTAQGLADIVKPLEESAAMSPEEQKLFLFYSSTPTSRALGQESLARINKRTVNRDQDTRTTAIQAQLTAMLRWAQPDAEALNNLAQIRQPVLVVNGHHDIMVPTENSYTLFHHLPNATLSLYPDSGHGSFFQYPELFLREAIPFLEAQ